MKKKIPLSIRVVCRYCMFNGKQEIKNPLLVCMAHGGMMVVVWSKSIVPFLHICWSVKLGKVG